MDNFKSFEEEAESFSKEDMLKKLASLQGQLKDMGVGNKISLISYAARRYGHYYEYRSYKLDGEEGGVKPTPLNCLAAIVHGQNDTLINIIQKGQIEQLLTIVGQIGICIEISNIKFPGTWPEDF